MKRIRKCIVDGVVYRYCSSCAEFQGEPLWKNIYCCENCRSIFNICSAYAGRELTKEEAQDELLSCDLSNIDNLRVSVKNTVENILSDE